MVIPKLWCFLQIKEPSDGGDHKKLEQVMLSDSGNKEHFNVNLNLNHML